jgi:hypothetical protein
VVEWIQVLAFTDVPKDKDSTPQTTCFVVSVRSPRAFHWELQPKDYYHNFAEGYTPKNKHMNPFLHGWLFQFLPS